MAKREKGNHMAKKDADSESDLPRVVQVRIKGEKI